MISKVPPELHMNCGANINFSSFRGILVLHGKKVNARKKLQVIINLPCLGYNTDKRNVVM